MKATYIIFLAVLLSKSIFAGQADINNDGCVDTKDLSILSSEWLSKSISSQVSDGRLHEEGTWIDGPGLQEKNHSDWYFSNEGSRFRDAEWPISVDGEITKIRINYKGSDYSLGAFKVYCYRGGTDYCPAQMVWQTDPIVPILLNSTQAVWQIDLSSLHLTVEAGDQLAFEPIASTGYNLSFDRICPNTSRNCFYDNGQGDGTGRNWTIKSGYGLQWEAEIISNLRIITQINNAADGLVLHTPALLSKPYYFIAQDVIVNADSVLTFAFQRRDFESSSGYSAVETLTLDLRDLTFQKIIANGNEVATSHADGRKIDFAIYFDMNTCRWNVLWSNKDYCEGGRINNGARDVTWRSHATAYTGRRVFPYAWGKDPLGDYIVIPSNNPLKENIYRSIRQIIVSSSGSVNVGSLAVCWQPIIMHGDSYSSTNATPTGVYLDGTGKALREEPYLYTPHVILLAAIGGNAITKGDSAKHGIAARYGIRFTQDKGAPLDNPDLSVVGFHDECEFVNAVFFLPNGPSVNDIMARVEPFYNGTNGQETRALGQQIVDYMIANISLIVGDMCLGPYEMERNYNYYTLKSKGNTAVLCSMCWRQVNGIEKEKIINDTIQLFNQRLKSLAMSLRLPYADITNTLGDRAISGYDPHYGAVCYGGFFDLYRRNYDAPVGSPPNLYADVHPNYTGYKKIAELMAETFNGTPAPNVPPVITLVTANPATILDTQTSQLAADANDVDGGPAPLSYHWIVPEGAGSVSDVAIANPIYTPADVTATQVVTLTVEVSDGEATVSRTVDVTVHDTPAPNIPPVITLVTANPATILDTQTSQLAADANDVDGGPAPLSYHWIVPEGAGSVSDVAIANPIYTPADVTATQVVTLTVEVSDGEATVSRTVDVTVHDTPAPNIPPVITLVTANPATILDTQTSQLAADANDVDGGPAPLSYHWIVPEGAGSVSDVAIANPIYTPADVTATQVVTLTVEVSDGEATVSRTVEVTVHDTPAPNIPPVITLVTASPATILDTQTSQLAADANDVDGGPAPLSYHWIVPEGAGSVSDVAIANPIYTPADVTATQVVTLTVEVSDGEATVSGTVEVTVHDTPAPNVPPVITLVTANPATILDTQTSQLAADANDVDGGPAPLSYHWIVPEGAGSVSDVAIANPIYTPADVTATQVVTLTVEVSDGEATVSRTVDVTVHDTPAPNIPPVITLVTANPATILDTQTSQLAADANDVDGGPAPLSYHWIVPEGAGSVSDVAIANPIYTPADVTATQVVTLTVEVSDGEATVSRTVDVTVHDTPAPNIPPVITLVTANPATILDTQTSQLAADANDVDGGPAPLSYHWIVPEGAGSVSDVAIANPIYTPADVTATQVVTLTVEVSDGEATVSRTVDVTVHDTPAPNIPPVITLVTANPATILDTQTSQLAADANDVDGGPAPLSYHWIVPEGAGSVSDVAIANPIYTPADVTATQVVTLTVEVSDGEATVSGTVEVTVHDTPAPNVPPVITLVTANPATILDTQTSQLAADANDVDGGPAPLSYHWIVPEGAGSVSDVAIANPIYTPADVTATQVVTLTVEVSDGEATVSGTVEVTVHDTPAPNVPPVITLVTANPATILDTQTSQLAADANDVDGGPAPLSYHWIVPEGAGSVSDVAIANPIYTPADVTATQVVTLTVEVSDGEATVSGTVEVTVHDTPAPNVPPVITLVTANPATILDTQTSQLAADANDVDGGPAPLSYHWIVPEGAGSVSDVAIANPIYTPADVTATQVVTLTVEVSDGEATVSGTVEVTVHDTPAPNVPPVITLVTANPATILDTQTSQLAADANDVDGGPAPLSYHWIVPEGAGSVSDVAIANPIYTPADVTATQVVTLTVEVSDGEATVSRTVDVTVHDTPAPNIPPVITLVTANPATILDTQTSQLAADANDVDGGPAPLSYHWIVPEGAGSVSDVAIANPIYTPADVTATQVVTLTVEVSDGEATVSGTVEVTVHDTPAPNIPPVITLVTANPATILDTQTSQLAADANDVDGGPAPLSYHWIVPEGAGSVSDVAIANPIYTPADVTATQVVTLTVEVSDGEATVSRTVDVTVHDTPAPNIPPVITLVTASPATILDTQTSQLAADANDVDGGPAPLSYHWIVPEGAGSVSDVAIANPIYTPADVTATRVVTLTVEVSDGEATVSRTVEVTVYDNDALIVLASFNADTDGFTYFDDLFYNTNEPLYASGMFIQAGGFTGGALKVSLGGADNIDILGMSGGWQTTFNLAEANAVRIAFMYNLTQSSNYEDTEFSNMTLSIDNVLIGSSDMDYITSITGDGNGGESITTGWQLFETIQELPAGIHTITIGGYNNKKDSPNEETTILIDDVLLLET